MADIILLAVIAIVVGIAANYIVKEKKKGVKCIGCPNSGTCSHTHHEEHHCGGNCSGGCGCHTK